MAEVHPENALKQSRWITPATQQRSQQTLERVLDATGKLLAQRAFREISVADIAKASRCSPPSIYARFENKPALLGALYERHTISQRQLYEQLFAIERWRDTGLGDILRLAFMQIVDSHRQEQGLIRAFLEEASENQSFRAAWAEQGDFLHQQVCQLVLSRPQEYRHPAPEDAIRMGLEAGFAVIAIRVLMRRIDRPHTNALTSELVSVMLKHLEVV
jgi:AcrR family transcriptional regulator